MIDQKRAFYAYISLLLAPMLWAGNFLMGRLAWRYPTVYFSLLQMAAHYCCIITDELFQTHSDCLSSFNLINSPYK